MTFTKNYPFATLFSRSFKEARVLSVLMFFVRKYLEV